MKIIILTFFIVNPGRIILSYFYFMSKILFVLKYNLKYCKNREKRGPNLLKEESRHLGAGYSLKV